MNFEYRMSILISLFNIRYSVFDIQKIKDPFPLGPVAAGIVEWYSPDRNKARR